MGEFGKEEGAVCWRDGCQGVIAIKPTENCRCHISPPCGACASAPLHCPKCPWEDEPNTFEMNGFVIKHTPGKEAYDWWKPRPLDPRKIDYRIKSHSNSSQLCEGVYPEGTTRAEVEARVKGTFGGRFTRFDNGKFSYVAYTD